MRGGARWLTLAALRWGCLLHVFHHAAAVDIAVSEKAVVPIGPTLGPETVAQKGTRRLQDGARAAGFVYGYGYGYGCRV